MQNNQTKELSEDEIDRLVSKDIEKWENGELGRDLEYARVVSTERAAAIDAAIGIKRKNV